MEPRLKEILQQIDLPKLVGYLNFSNGKPDVRFQKSWNQAQQAVAELDYVTPWFTLCKAIQQSMTELQETGGNTF
ncbi:MAG TPA: hypothetical protein PKA06_03515 [Gemmatales bacterium]|nr:hypothetical protein [Gemmatales bacterium]